MVVSQCARVPSHPLGTAGARPASTWPASPLRVTARTSACGAGSRCPIVIFLANGCYLNYHCPFHVGWGFGNFEERPVLLVICYTEMAIVLILALRHAQPVIAVCLAAAAIVQGVEMWHTKRDEYCNQRWSARAVMDAPATSSCCSDHPRKEGDARHHLLAPLLGTLLREAHKAHEQ